MHETDLHAVLAIERRAYDYPWTEGIFHDCLRVGYCCWVSMQEAVITGYAVMSVGAGEAHLLNICVRPESRRGGLGHSLLTHMLSLARKHAADMALLEVRPSNRDAIKLYHELGFNEVGVRKSYYPATHGKEDAIILACSLV